jgi:glutamate/tyrosine decarboxylase-like PLP-dependent enzyme
MLNKLQGSIPMASYRNQSHMNWDLTLPGFIGYFAAMLYNQNNVAAEASPVTTLLEIQVGKDLCELLGFGKSGEPEPWGHITCDGSIANGEAMWAARNLKFLPVALAAAIAVDRRLHDAKDFTVATCQGGRDYLIDLDLWSLLNLPIDEVIDMVSNIQKQTGIKESVIRQTIDDYSVQSLGLVRFQQQFLDTYNQAEPVVLVPATAHYSWPKSAALIGLGTASVRPVEVDLDGRMDMIALRRELDRCLKNQQPVLQVVAVMGTTAEGAVDPLADILKIREDYQAMGLNFIVHVDAAWGGYFRSILRVGPPGSGDKAEIIDDHPEIYVNDYFSRHFDHISQADSVTLDPHKSGFIPYPAGSLCYRNGAMRDLIAYTSPVVFHGGFDVTVGPYGIEGSKPGAAAASVYLSHKVIPLDRRGYGRMLGRCLFNNKRFYAALVAMDIGDSNNSRVDFNITPFQRLPAEKDGESHGKVLEQKRYIKEHLVPYETPELIKHVFGLSGKQSEEQEKALKLFQDIGSDLSIVAYAFNFKIDGKLNASLKHMNEFNSKIYREFSLKPSESGDLPENNLFITSSEFDPQNYGQQVIDDFVIRTGTTPKQNMPVTFLISTTQNPWLSSTSRDTSMINDLIDILGEKVSLIAAEMADARRAESTQTNLQGE